ncbi:hypothetical protein DPEC_G00181110 [Dallia pectoralis]|uniref:Uncharacterized protein n=1 Tax=Dallia pectoralis TaxID=75939 RepID=A0ACC2GA64_DALPE|nr:hypothetical protein DPEC_G00181110 [Dallia pectoralis]
MARLIRAFWKSVGAGLLGFPYGVPGGLLLSSTLAAAGTCDLVTSIQRVKESHSWPVQCLTLLTGIILLIGSVPVIGGLLYLAALVAYRRTRRMWRTQDNELYAAKVVLVGLSVLVGIPFINGCFGFLMEAAAAQSDILTLYKCSAEMAVKVACVLASLMVAAFAAGGTDALAAMQDRLGLGVVELGAAAVIGWGTLGALDKYHTALGQWGTVGGMMGPAVAAGVALSAGPTSTRGRLSAQYRMSTWATLSSMRVGSRENRND